MCEKHGKKIIFEDEEAGWGAADRKICPECVKESTDRLMSRIESLTAKPKKIVGPWNISDQAVKNLTVTRL